MLSHCLRHVPNINPTFVLNAPCFCAAEDTAALTHISSSWWTYVVIQCWVGVVQALQRCYRRWANIEPALGRCIVYRPTRRIAVTCASQKDALPGIESTLAQHSASSGRLLRVCCGHIDTSMKHYLVLHGCWLAPVMVDQH